MVINIIMQCQFNTWSIKIAAGLPRLVHTDRGTENAKVAYLQPFLIRYNIMIAGTRSFQYAKSVSNQVSDKI